jgi:dCMP deaminase
MGTLASYNILSRMMLLFDMIVRLSALNFYLFIINTAKRIVGIGYNGFPHGCNDAIVPWRATNDGAMEQTVLVPWLHTKHPYKVPAKINAVLNRCRDTQGSSIYVAHFPCNECAKIIIQSGIREVVYVNKSGINQSGGTTSLRAARKLFDLAGVLMRQYVAQGRDPFILRLTFNDNEKDRLYGNDLKGDNGGCYYCGIEIGPKNNSTQQNRINLDDETIKRDILILEKEANYKVDLSELVAPKRQSYLSWDDYFMCVAYLSSQRSKDPNTQVGACILNAMKQIACVGRQWAVGSSFQLWNNAKTLEKKTA